MEKVKIRGLGRLAGWVLSVWGGIVFLKAFYDLFVGEPEANLYAPSPWSFVTRAEWMRYGGFELAYGLALLGLGWFAFQYSRFLPEFVERARKEPEFKLFD